MSGRNWTPGPWRYFLQGDSTRFHVTARPTTKPGNSFDDFATVRSDHEADARLIAAAPALYEALAATPCTCTTVAGASHGGQTEQLLDELCGRCAALRLAEGDEA